MMIFKKSSPPIAGSEGRHCEAIEIVSQQQAIAPGIVGKWQKDMKRSTPVDAAAELIGLSGLVKEGIKLVRGFELVIEGPVLKMTVYSAVPLVKINELYALNGSETSNLRRDLRFGKARCKLEVTPTGMPLLRLRWGDPYGGEGLDEFKLVGPDELHVISTITVNGHTVSYTSVHVRKV